MNTRAEVRRLASFPDERGLLIVGEVGQHVPYTPARFFAMTNMPVGAVRGAHAHRVCEQYVVVLSGACRVTVIDERGRDEFTVSSPMEAVYVPALVWLELQVLTAGTVVLVLASEPYDAQDYVRSLPEFERIVSQ